MTLASNSGNEGNSGTTDINLTVTMPTNSAAQVFYRMCFSGTATVDRNDAVRQASEDYQVLGSNSVAYSGNIFPDSGDGAGCIGALGELFQASGSSKTYKLRIHSDTVAEEHETIRITLRESNLNALPTGITLPNPSTLTYTITNDDAHKFSVSIADAGADEGDSGHTDYKVILIATPPLVTGGGRSDAWLDICFTGTARFRNESFLDPDDNPIRHHQDYRLVTGSGGNTIAQVSGGAKAGCVQIDGSTSLSRLVQTSDALGGGIYLRVLGDTRQEPDETVTVTISRRTGSVNPTPPDIQLSDTVTERTDTFTIRGDDHPQVNLSVSSGNATETGGTVTITATRSEANTSGGALTIPIMVKTSGTTASSSDYTALAPSISIANSATTGTTTFTATADTTDEPPETVVVELGTLPSGTQAGTDDEVTITIVDDDPTEVSLSRTGSGAVTEGGVIEFTVTASRALIAGEVIDVPLSISGTGVTTADWSLAKKSGNSLNTGVTVSGQATATPKVRFSGAGARIATLELTATADTVDESTGEGYVIALGPDGTATNGFDVTTLGTNVGGGADPHATANTLTVQVNEAVIPPVTPPVVTIAPTTANTPITEGAAASYTLTATPAPAVAVTVNLMVADVAGSDFIAAANEGAKTVTIPTTGTATYTVDTVDDTRVYDANGDVTVTVVADDADPVTYTVGDPASASIPIEDNDRPNVFWMGNVYSYTEDNAVAFGKVVVQFASSILGSPPLMIHYTLGGTATCGTDYTIAGADCATGTGTLAVPAGTMAFDFIEFPLTILTDSVADNAETITVAFAPDPGYNFVTASDRHIATVTIFEDSGGAELSITGNPWVGETLSIQRDQSDPDGDGDPNRYSYNWQWSASLTEPDWKVYSVANTSITVDSTALNRYLRGSVRYTDGIGYQSISYTDPIGPITGTPSLPVLTLTGGSPITEGQPVEITVTSDRALPGQSLSLLWDVVDAPGADFLDDVPASNGNALWTFAFLASDSGATRRRFEIPTVCDTTTEPSGNITVEIRSRPGEYTIGNPATAMVMVNDGGNCGRRTPITPRPTFGAGSIADQSWTRGQEIAALQLPQASGGTGTLTYSLSPSAPSGVLYDAGAYRLTGVPAQALEQTQYAWIATDENGATATLPFTITITDVGRLRIQDAVRSALSALARRSLSSAITNISTRFAEISGSGLTLAGHAIPLNATPRERLATEEACRLQQSQSGWSRPTATRPDCVYTSQGLRSAELLTSSDFSFVLGATEPAGAYTAETPRWSL